MCDSVMTNQSTAWKNALDDPPKNSNQVLGAYIEECGDVKIWQYAVVRYDHFTLGEWMKDGMLVDIKVWKEIEKPLLRVNFQPR